MVCAVSNGHRCICLTPIASREQWKLPIIVEDCLVELVDDIAKFSTGEFSTHRAQYYYNSRSSADIVRMIFI